MKEENVEEEFNEDFYSLDCIETSIDDDEINCSEEGFMRGYLNNF